MTDIHVQLAGIGSGDARPRHALLPVAAATGNSNAPREFARHMAQWQHGHQSGQQSGKPSGNSSNIPSDIPSGHPTGAGSNAPPGGSGLPLTGPSLPLSESAQPPTDMPAMQGDTLAADSRWLDPDSQLRQSPPLTWWQPGSVYSFSEAAGATFTDLNLPSSGATGTGLQEGGPMRAEASAPGTADPGQMTSVALQDGAEASVLNTPLASLSTTAEESAAQAPLLHSGGATVLQQGVTAQYADTGQNAAGDPLQMRATTGEQAGATEGIITAPGPRSGDSLESAARPARPVGAEPMAQPAPAAETASGDESALARIIRAMPADDRAASQSPAATAAGRQVEREVERASRQARITENAGPAVLRSEQQAARMTEIAAGTDRLQRFADQWSTMLNERMAQESGMSRQQTAATDRAAPVSAGLSAPAPATSPTSGAQASLTASPILADTQQSMSQTGRGVNAEQLAAQERAFSQAGGREKWGEGLSRRIALMTAQNNTQAQLQLDPPELGRLLVNIQINGEQASVNFASPHAFVREALEGTFPKLQEMLAEQGFELTDAGVSDQSAGNQGDQDDNPEQGTVAAGSGPDDDALNTGMNSEGVGVSLVDYYA